MPDSQCADRAGEGISRRVLGLLRVKSGYPLVRLQAPTLVKRVASIRLGQLLFSIGELTCCAASARG